MRRSKIADGVAGWFGLFLNCKENKLGKGRLGIFYTEDLQDKSEQSSRSNSEKAGKGRNIGFNITKIYKSER